MSYFILNISVYIEYLIYTINNFLNFNYLIKLLWRKKCFLDIINLKSIYGGEICYQNLNWILKN